MQVDPIYLGMVITALIGGTAVGWAWRNQKTRTERRSWPRRWNLNARPLFNAHERALYRELRAALPQHVVLAKVSLLRFCQSADEVDAQDWYKRLQSLNVGLVVCTPNGSVITAIDIDHHLTHQGLRRSQRLKEAVLEACRVRYIRSRPGQWPQPGLLAAWALGHHTVDTPRNAAAGSRQAEQADLASAFAQADPVHDAGDKLARKLKQRRAERAVRWSESSFSQDSFFAFDSRLDAAANSAPLPLSPPEAQAAAVTNKALTRRT